MPTAHLDTLPVVPLTKVKPAPPLQEQEPSSSDRTFRDHFSDAASGAHAQQAPSSEPSSHAEGEISAVAQDEPHDEIESTDSAQDSAQDTPDDSGAEEVADAVDAAQQSAADSPGDVEPSNVPVLAPEGVVPDGKDTTEDAPAADVSSNTGEQSRKAGPNDAPESRPDQDHSGGSPASPDDSAEVVSGKASSQDKVPTAIAAKADIVDSGTLVPDQPNSEKAAQIVQSAGDADGKQREIGDGSPVEETLLRPQSRDEPSHGITEGGPKHSVNANSPHVAATPVAGQGNGAADAAAAIATNSAPDKNNEKPAKRAAPSAAEPSTTSRLAAQERPASPLLQGETVTPSLRATETASVAAAEGSGNEAAPPASEANPSASSTPAVEAPAQRLSSLLSPARSRAPSDGQPLTESQQVRLIQRVARAFDVAHTRGESTIRLRLSPPELGSLRLEVQMESGTLTARLEVETITARNTLLDNLGTLRQRLAEQNIQVEQFDVDLLERQSSGSADAREQQASQQKSDERTNRANDSADTSAAEAGDDAIAAAHPSEGDGILDVTV